MLFTSCENIKKWEEYSRDLLQRFGYIKVTFRQRKKDDVIV